MANPAIKHGIPAQEHWPKSLKTRATKYNEKLGELNQGRAPIEDKREQLFQDALTGNVSGDDFVKRVRDLEFAEMRADVDLRHIDVERDAILKDARDEALKLSRQKDKLAAERRAKMEDATKDFQGRAVDREQLIRADEGIRNLKLQANAARAAANDTKRPQDEAWQMEYEAKVRSALRMNLVMQGQVS